MCDNLILMALRCHGVFTKSFGQTLYRYRTHTPSIDSLSMQEKCSKRGAFKIKMIRLIYSAIHTFLIGVVIGMSIV